MQNQEALKLVVQKLAEEQLTHYDEIYAKRLLDAVTLTPSLFVMANIPKPSKYAYLISLTSVLISLLVSRLCHYRLVGKEYKQVEKRIKMLKKLKKRLERGQNMFEEIEIQDFEEELEKHLRIR